METVKYIADIETPTSYTAYLVDGSMTVPINGGNSDYHAVQAWIAEGNTVEPAFTFEELRAYTVIQLNQEIPIGGRHITDVPLEDGVTTLQIWGGREDQLDIGDRYSLMAEDNIPNIYIQTTDGQIHHLFHLDVKRCYKAITIHRNNIINYVLLKEIEIMACTTQTELDNITWDIGEV